MKGKMEEWKGLPGSLYAQMDEQLERSFDRCYNLYEREAVGQIVVCNQGGKKNRANVKQISIKT